MKGRKRARKSNQKRQKGGFDCWRSNERPEKSKEKQSKTAKKAVLIAGGAMKGQKRAGMGRLAGEMLEEGEIVKMVQYERHKTHRMKSVEGTE